MEETEKSASEPRSPATLTPARRARGEDDRPKTLRNIVFVSSEVQFAVRKEAAPVGQLG